MRRAPPRWPRRTRGYARRRPRPPVPACPRSANNWCAASTIRCWFRAASTRRRRVRGAEVARFTSGMVASYELTGIGFVPGESIRHIPRARRQREGPVTWIPTEYDATAPGPGRPPKLGAPRHHARHIHGNAGSGRTSGPRCGHTNARGAARAGPPPDRPSRNRAPRVRKQGAGPVAGPSIRSFLRDRTLSPYRTVGAGHRYRDPSRPSRTACGAARAAGFTTLSGHPGRVRTLLGPGAAGVGSGRVVVCPSCCRRGPVRPPVRRPEGTARQRSTARAERSTVQARGVGS